MTKEQDKDSPSRQNYRVFFRDGVPYVPHFRDENIYVAPGRRPSMMTAEELIAAGAVARIENLWQRAWDKRPVRDA